MTKGKCAIRIFIDNKKEGINMKLKTHDERLTLTNGNYHSLVKARKPTI